MNIFNVENSCAADFFFFVENRDTLHFSRLTEEYEVQKNCFYLKYKSSVAL